MTPIEQAYLVGRRAGRDRKEPTENPHPKGLFIDSSLWDAWAKGWVDGRDARARNARKRVRAFNRA